MSISTVAPYSVDTVQVVASNIRAEASRLGYSQSELGRAIGISQGQVTRRWNGKIPWQLTELDAVAALLNVSVNDLVTPPRGGLGYEKAPATDKTGGISTPPGIRTLNPLIRSFMQVRYTLAA